jgi:tRNA nucleotidyltransferase (CCA-adding enzyme)
VDHAAEIFTESRLGRDPLHAIKLIHDLSLYSTVFPLPDIIASALSAPPGPYISSLSATTMLHMLLNPLTNILPTLHPTLVSAVTPSVKARLFLAAALTPFKGITYTDSKKKTHLVVDAVIREGLRLGTQNHYLDDVPLLFASAGILENPDLSQERFTVPSQRVAIGQSQSPALFLCHSFTVSRPSAARQSCS